VVDFGGGYQSSFCRHRRWAYNFSAATPLTRGRSDLSPHTLRSQGGTGLCLATTSCALLLDRTLVSSLLAPLPFDWAANTMYRLHALGGMFAGRVVVLGSTRRGWSTIYRRRGLGVL